MGPCALTPARRRSRHSVRYFRGHVRRGPGSGDEARPSWCDLRAGRARETGERPSRGQLRHHRRVPTSRSNRGGHRAPASRPAGAVDRPHDARTCKLRPAGPIATRGTAQTWPGPSIRPIPRAPRLRGRSSDRAAANRDPQKAAFELRPKSSHCHSRMLDIATRRESISREPPTHSRCAWRVGAAGCGYGLNPTSFHSGAGS